MTFRRYDHLERIGHSEVDGILIGTVHVFPKLDGTCGSLWIEDGQVQCASRNRILSPADDNHGFCAWAWDHAITLVPKIPPRWIVYGEWLVPHTLKTYRDDAWRRFWVFDVFCVGRYLPFQDYSEIIRDAGLDVIEPLCTITNPTEDQLCAEVDKNTYLVRDGCGAGEGIVVKNYGWANRFGRQPWAKIVRNEFKEENRRAFGVTEKTGEFQVEAAIAEEFVTGALVDKTRAKIVADIANAQSVTLDPEGEVRRRIEAEHRGRVISELLGRVFHDLVVEEIWTILKKHRNPVVDFKRLNQHVTARVKALAGDLFA
jgi:hypothetical protein